jgi:nitrate reductase cytochrome c-type subunit
LAYKWRAGLVVAGLGLVALALGACGGTIGGEGYVDQTLATSDIGARTYLHRSLATGDIGSSEYTRAAPGASEILPRDYPGAPPFIPHSLNGLTITTDLNVCLSCHATGLSFGEGHTATVIPLSHYTDQVDWTVTEELQDLRYDCLLCHLQQSSE